MSQLAVEAAETVDVEDSTSQVSLEEPAGPSRPAPQAPPASLDIKAGQLIAHYRIQSLLGKGGTAEVYRAWDTRLARPVALKFLRSDRISPDRVGRLLHEGRVLARLTDPGVVRIYQVLEVRGLACLVMEFVDGDTLRERIAEGPLPRSEVLRLSRALAHAIGTLHAAGYTHCDLKPANVMLGRDGRPRLVDFGLAARVNGAAQGGTPLYMSPEQWRGEPQQAATDIWALGLLIIEMLTGRPALAGSTDDIRGQLDGPHARPPTVPAELTPTMASLLARCVALEPQARPRADAVVETLDAELATPGAVPLSPFKGLAPFDSDDAALFLGREMESDLGVEQLRRTAAVLVAGPSGVGKSSVILAGILPRLIERGPIELLRMRPGERPLFRLATRLLPDSELAEREALTEELTHEPGRLEVLLLSRAQRRQCTQVLVIDQLEELFAVSDPEQRAPFARALAAAVHDPGQPIRLVASMRDDHYGDLARLPRLLAAFGQPLILGPLDAPRLRRAFVRPVEALAYRFDAPELIDGLLDGLEDNPVALPLIQFCGEQLWSRRDQGTRTLPISELTQSGGLAEVLQATAEGFFRALTDPQREAVRQICLQLVGDDGTRRAVERERLLSEADSAAALAMLVDARLVISRGDPDGSSQVVELAHESLVSGWKRLRNWIDGSGAGRSALLEAERLAALWEQEGDRILWPGPRARLTRDALAQAQLTAPPAVERYLEACLAKSRRQRRNWSVAGALALAGLLAGLYVWQSWAKEQALQLGNVGRFRIEIEMIDLDLETGAHRPAAPDIRPRQRLLQRPDDWWRRAAPPPVLNTEERGGWINATGPALLEVTDRGRPHERCAPSLIPIELPGFDERQLDRVIRVRIPSCKTTFAGMIHIPAGEALIGGRGNPPLPAEAPIGSLELPEAHRVQVQAFTIDAQETTNGQYEAYRALREIHGDSGPLYNPTLGGDAPELPVTRISAQQASAYCRWLGKRLPTPEEFEKAARGGAFLGDAVNPLPDRSMPNGGRLPTKDELKAATTRASAAHGRDLSPYGVGSLASNVWEWVAAPRDPAEADWWQLRGGGWTAEAPWELSVQYRNLRHVADRYHDAGVRCAADAPASLSLLSPPPTARGTH